MNIFYSYPLFQVIVTDGCGHGRPVMYCLSSHETTNHVVIMLSDFQSMFPSTEKVETFTMDCSSTLMKAVHDTMPWVNIVLCYFHIKQAVMRKVSMASMIKFPTVQESILFQSRN